GKMPFGGPLGLSKSLPKARVSGEGFQPAQLTQIRDPAVAYGGRDGMSELRVRQQQPAARRDPVRLIVEGLRKGRGGGFDGRVPQQLRVNRRHAVGTMRADDGQVGHAYFWRCAALDQAHVLNAFSSARTLAANLIEQAFVDLADDLRVSRQRDLKPRERPLLQSLRH